MNVVGKKPEFCFITPIKYLKYATESSTHLVLAHLVDTNDEYAQFYKERSEAGDFIMCDNSAYELKEPYKPEKLIEIGNKCGAHAIVLPDYPFQPGSVTISAAKEFIPIFKEAGFKTFFVPQSKRGDLDDWIDCYSYAANNTDIDIIGLSILGVPNALPNIDPSFSRVVMTQLLIDRGIFNFDKHHHYLGLNAGPKLEIPSLLRMGVLDSIDSSGPVWAGITGHRYTDEADSYQTVSKIKLPVDFNIPMTKDKLTISRIQHNIDMTNDLFDPEKYINCQKWYAEE